MEWWKSVIVCGVLLVVLGADVATFKANGREAVGFAAAAVVAWQWKRCAAKGVAAVHRARSELVDKLMGPELEPEEDVQAEVVPDSK